MALSFLAKGKGQIKIEVTNRAYAPGDLVDVQVRLTTKKDLGPGRLYGALVGTERREVRRRDVDGHMGDHVDTEVDRVEIYRREVDLAVDASFSRGTDERMTFALHIPQPPRMENADVPGWVGTLAEVARWLGPDVRLEWMVEVRYDIPRLDLSDRQKLSVNL